MNTKQLVAVLLLAALLLGMVACGTSDSELSLEKLLATYSWESKADKTTYLYPNAKWESFRESGELAEHGTYTLFINKIELRDEDGHSERFAVKKFDKYSIWIEVDGSYIVFYNTKFIP